MQGPASELLFVIGEWSGLQLCTKRKGTEYCIRKTTYNIKTGNDTSRAWTQVTSSYDSCRRRLAHKWNLRARRVSLSILTNMVVTAMHTAVRSLLRRILHNMNEASACVTLRDSRIHLQSTLLRAPPGHRHPPHRHTQRRRSSLLGTGCTRKSDPGRLLRPRRIPSRPYPHQYTNARKPCA